MNQIPVKKNETYIVDIVDNGFGGEGIAKIDGFTVFIPNAIKGEKVKVKILKVLSSHGFGKVEEIIDDMNKMNKILIATTQSILSGEEIDTNKADELIKLYSSQLTITANIYSIVKFIKSSSNNAIDLSDKLEDDPVEIDVD